MSDAILKSDQWPISLRFYWDDHPDTTPRESAILTGIERDALQSDVNELFVGWEDT